ncbi:UDP-glycosyltransferase 73C6-like [Phragmites australis]|uniref:UDP-glycosyltransferase 73C6-like n=1 Tax=Phragmites australis TaxID=29695 RepID=UPI002D789E02|nr:UDP-glycosyltransferase 73C6-like [Phragmites australis]
MGSQKHITNNKTTFSRQSLKAAQMAIKDAAKGMGTTDDVGSNAKAHFVFIPLMFQGHLIPAVDTALLLATHGALASIVVTPSNTGRIRPTIDFARKSGLPVRLVELALDCAAEGLPDGADDVDKVPSCLWTNYFRAVALLREPLERHLRAHEPYPTCVVSDFCHPWAKELAASFEVPRLCFFSMCSFCLLCQHNVERFNAYDGVDDDNELVIVPGLEKRFEVSRAQAPGFFRGFPGFEKLADDVEQALVEADGIVTNSFLEMEPEYVAGYAEARGMKVWTVGPVSLFHNRTVTLASRGNTAAIGADECLRWLDSKEPNSVVYVSFGSIAHAEPNQVVELGLGLEASGHPFIWVVKNADQHGDEVSEFLHELEAHVAGRGLLIRGWAPQVLILSHAAVGGFVTHCGWNSTMEAITAGLPVVTWPHFSDQFLNAKFAVEVLGIGVSIGVTEPVMYRVDQKEIVVRREVVEKAVRSVMDGGGEGEERRMRARALAAQARSAVEEGGSSHANLLDLIKNFEVDAGCDATA